MIEKLLDKFGLWWLSRMKEKLIILPFNRKRSSLVDLIDAITDELGV